MVDFANDLPRYINIKFDISWVDFANDLPSENPHNILDVIDKMKNAGKLDRILFGTDAPLGCYGEAETLKRTRMQPKQAYELTVSRIKTAIKNRFADEADAIIEKIFYENSNELFFEKKWAKSGRIGKTAGIIAGAGGVGAIVYSILKHNPKDKIQNN